MLEMILTEIFKARITEIFFGNNFYKAHSFFTFQKFWAISSTMSFVYNTTGV